MQAIRRRARIKLRRLNKLTTGLFSRSYFKALVILELIAVINFYSVAGLSAAITQLCVFGFGTVLALIISNLKYGTVKRLAVPIYLGVCGLLVMVAMVGSRINGAQRWLKLGIFTLQPSELLKLALILVIGYYLQARIKPNTRKDKEYNLLDLFAPLTITIMPLILVLKEPDLGTTIICLLIVSSILFFMGVEKKTFALILVVLIGCGVAGWKHMKAYQRERIVNFLRPEVDVQNKNWQPHQALIAFGSGGMVGKGMQKGTETQLKFLPEPLTDFALASLAEEHGFITVVLVLGVINFIALKLLFIAHHVKDKFAAVVLVGAVFWIVGQAVINTLMVTNAIPVVGVPFPLISYGGSSLLALLIMIGCVTNIELRNA